MVEKRTDGIPQMDMDTSGRYGIADGIQTLRLVRRRAAEWGISPTAWASSASPGHRRSARQRHPPFLPHRGPQGRRSGPFKPRHGGSPTGHTVLP
jgi:hypothetical protein